MWYTDSNKSRLDYSKPIIAEKGEYKFVLMPHVGSMYQVNGFDWYNFSQGRWNSCANFKTVEEAIEVYKSYTIRNGSITIE